MRFCSRHSAGVMREAICLLLTCIVTSGCASSNAARDNCMVPRGWTRTEAPGNRDALLRLKAPNTRASVLGELELSGPSERSEVWFKDKSGALMACSYLRARDVCGADGRTVQFHEKENGQWQAMEALSVVCVTHNNTMEPTRVKQMRLSSVSSCRATHCYR